jgi:hypothetical protein
MAANETLIKQSFDDWTHLLKMSKNLDLLDDPFSIWYEAFETARILERIDCQAIIQTSFPINIEPGDDKKKITIEDAKVQQRELIEKIVELLQTKQADLFEFPEANH